MTNKNVRFLLRFVKAAWSKSSATEVYHELRHRDLGYVGGSMLFYTQAKTGGAIWCAEIDFSSILLISVFI